MTDTSNIGTLAHYWLAGVALIGLLILFVVNAVLSWRLLSPKRSFVWRLLAIVLGIGGYFGASFAASHYYTQWTETLPKGKGTVTNLVMSAKIRAITRHK